VFSTLGSNAALPWVLFAVAALLVLRVPFTGDQYFFADAARTLANGGRLYVDIWDIKQPGIFGIYWLASAFGDHTAIAVRGIEILCWALSAALCIDLLRRAGVSAAVAAWAPAVAAVTVLLAAPAWHLSQVESFVPAALLAATWSVLVLRHPLARWGVFGVATAFIAWLKLLYVVIPAAIAASVLVAQHRAMPLQLLAETGRALVVSTLFAVGTLVALLWPLVSLDSIGPLFDANFRYPLNAFTGLSTASIGRLMRAALWFGATSAPLLLLAPCALRPARVEPIRLALLAWIVAAAVCVIAQRFSWWAYHFTLLKLPVALLALLAVHQVLQQRPRLQPHAAALMAILFTVTLIPSVGQIVSKARAVPSMGRSSDLPPDVERRLAPGYERIRASAYRFRSYAPVGTTLCVLGDPARAYLSGASCPVAIRYWSEPALNSEKWRDMATALRRERPDVVFLERVAREAITLRAPSVVSWLEADYARLGSNTSGDVWYARQDASVARMVTPFAD
jgi:hypothetical protein